jgi:hypothetical protein
MLNLAYEQINHLMFCQPAPDIRAIFNAVSIDEVRLGDPQFLFQAAMRTAKRIFAPVWMGATGVRPQTRCVVFPQGAALDQDIIPRH